MSSARTFYTENVKRNFSVTQDFVENASYPVMAVIFKYHHL